MVHITEGYGNPLQDAIGSFGYICVTLFFMISAYGMQLSAEKKNDYLRHFWRNRLLALLVPCALINVFVLLVFWALKGTANISSLWHLNNYVLVLLEYCLLFYIVMWCAQRMHVADHRITDSILIASVVISSLVSYIFFDKGGWCYERLGLVWGLLLYRFLSGVKDWLTQKRKLKIVVFSLACIVLGVSYLKFKDVFFWGEYLLKICLGVTIIMWILLLTVKRQFGNKFSFWLGRISYEVYLLHGFIMSSLVIVAPNLSSGVFILLTYILTLAISTPIQIGTGWIVKKFRLVLLR